MRQRSATGEKALIAGIGLITIGVVGFVLAFLTDVSVAGGQPITLMLAGGQAVIIGTLLICYHRLMERTTANDQALRFQYDIGYEDGYQEHRKLQRPTVVDLESHRALTSAGGVVDRG